MSLNVEILEESFEKIKPLANEFAASFYENLFKAHPEIKPLFSKTDMPSQQTKLLSSLVLVVENIRDPEAFGPLLNGLGARHVGYGAIPKYYGLFGQALLSTLEQYLQQDWTDEVKEAWVNAFRLITELMLKGANEEFSAKVVPAEQPVISSNPSALKPESQKESQVFQSAAKQKKKRLVSIVLNGEVLKQIINNFSVIYQQFPQKLSQQPLSEILQEISKKVIDIFWILPTWLVAMVSAVIFTLLVVVFDDNSVFAEIINSTETISIVVALVIFIKEAPDRRKQFHYQAWSTIDAAHKVKVSYARILALQDLNEDGVSLRGLDAPCAELININLPHANLSQANLMESDLTNSNLSHANLDNANLSQAKLIGVNFHKAKLGFANLKEANLNSANLSGANLMCADLRDANLSGANLRKANLSGANLEGAYLTGANLKNAQVGTSELINAFVEGAIMPNGSKYQSSDGDR